MPARPFSWPSCPLLAIALSLTTIAAAHAQNITSTFDTDADGWGMGSGGGAGNVSWSPLGGNPGGGLRIDDNTFTAIVPDYYGAAPKFLGDRSASYGRQLLFDLRTEPAGPVFASARPGVVLTGPSDSLVHVLGHDPTSAFTTFAVPLVETAWHIGTELGPAPTQSQFQAVLANLSELKINGDYDLGSGTTTYLDNVILQVPEPRALALVFLLLLCRSTALLRSRNVPSPSGRRLAAARRGLG